MKNDLLHSASRLILALSLTLAAVGCHRPADPAPTFEQCLDAYVAKPERGLFYKFLAEAPVDDVMPIAEAGGPIRVAQFLLLRVDYRGAQADELALLFKLPFTQVVAAARSTLWPHPLPTNLRNAIYFEQASAFDGPVASSLLTLQSNEGDVLSSLQLTKERLYCMEVWQDNSRSVVAINANRLRSSRQPRGEVQFDTQPESKFEVLDWPSPVTGLPAAVLKPESGYIWPRNGVWPAWARPLVPERFAEGLKFDPETKADPTLIELRPASSSPSFVNSVGR